jgi:hypothetical protein
MTMKQYARKVVLAGLAGLTAMVTLAACSSDNNGPTIPAVPTGLAVAPVNGTTAHVSWSASSGATSYSLQRALKATPTVYTDIGGAITGTSYDDATLTLPVTEYAYRVAATNAEGTSAYSANVSFSAGVLTGDITASRTLYSDTLYTLSGYVKVQNGATLTIQAGTRITGDTLVPGSSLWILRGAKIQANGTAAAPIVFTSGRLPGNRKPGDWGGIIIIGNGIINRTGSSIQTEGGAANESENYALGTDNSDNSGTLRYVRIEFAGYDVSNGAGQELNTLSSYAVGRGTTYEYIESLSGLDDSFEYWGGAVDGRYLVSYESGDDHFDWTEGYQGRNQFLIAFQSTRLAPHPGSGVLSADPRGFEGDGCDPGVTGCTLTATGASTPYSMPVWANFTMIGAGTLVAGFPANGNGGVWRRGTGGTVYNGVLSRFTGIGINILDAWTDSLWTGSGGKDSLWISNTLLATNAGGNLDANYAAQANWNAGRLATMLQYAGDVQVDTLLGYTLTPPSLNFKPKAGSPATTGGMTAPPALVTSRTAGYFGGTWVNTSYIGAVDPAAATAWYSGWTVYETN